MRSTSFGLISLVLLSLLARFIQECVPACSDYTQLCAPDNICRLKCQNSHQCPLNSKGIRLVCHPTLFLCYEMCRFHSDCDLTSGMSCIVGYCQNGCLFNSDCGSGMKCNRNTSRCEFQCLPSPCPETSSYGCAPDGVCRMRCSACLSTEMCNKGFCYALGSTPDECVKNTQIASQSINYQVISGVCYRYCVDDADCPLFMYCSYQGKCLYKCTDPTCLLSCSPDGQCLYECTSTGSITCPDTTNYMCKNNFCYRICSTTSTELGNTFCKSYLSNSRCIKGVCKLSCVSDSDCDAYNICNVETGLCTRDPGQIDLIRLENCWEENVRLTINFQTYEACVTIEPTQRTLCRSHLPKSVYIEINFSSYSQPLKRLLSNYSYNTTKNICIVCPADRVRECSESMRASQAASMAVYTDTHLGFALVSSMTTLTTEYNDCFDSLASTLLIRNPERSTTGETSATEKFACCTYMKSTGSCNFLANYRITKFQFIVSSNGSSYPFYPNREHYDPESGVYCVEYEDQDTEEIALLNTFIADPWTKATFELEATVDQILVRSTTNMDVLRTSYRSECYSSIDTFVLPDLVYVELVTNDTAIASCSLPQGVNTVDMRISIQNLITGQKMGLSYQFLKFQFNTNKRLFFFATTTEEKAQTLQFYNYMRTNGSTSKFTGSLGYNYRRPGETSITAATSKFFFDTLTPSCFNYTVAVIKEDGLCIQLQNVHAQDCALPSIEMLFTATVEIFSSTDLIYTLGSFNKSLNFSTAISSVCFSCDTDFQRGTSEQVSSMSSLTIQGACLAALKDMWKYRKQRVVGLQLIMDESIANYVSYKSPVMTMSTIQNMDYSTVYFICGILAGSIVGLGLVFGVIMIVRVQRQAKQFIKLHKQAKRKVKRK